MSSLDNAIKVGKPNQNLVLETGGRIYVKVQDKFYELDFKNKNVAPSNRSTTVVNNIVETAEAPNLDNYVDKNFLRSTLNEYVSKRDWKDIKETTQMLENLSLEGFTESISPITINTMQVVVGSEQLQYDFIEDYNDDDLASRGFVGDNPLGTYHVKLTGGWIKHYTLDGPNVVRPVTELNKQEVLTQYCRWHIEDAEFDLLSEAYYVYIKVPVLNKSGYEHIVNGYPSVAGQNSYYLSPADKANNITSTLSGALLLKTNEGTSPSISDEEGEFIVSMTPIDLVTDDDNTHYNLLYAIINAPGDGGERSYTTMNGFTEITPGRVTAYRFMSPDGIQYLNFYDKTFHLGDSNSYIHFDANEGEFKIKGTIVQSPSGQEFPVPCYRGEFTEAQIKYGLADDDPTTNPPIFYYGDSIRFDGCVWLNTFKAHSISGVTPYETVTVTTTVNNETTTSSIYPWSLYADKGESPFVVRADKEIDGINVDNEGICDTATTISINFWLYKGEDRQILVSVPTVTPTSLDGENITASITAIRQDPEDNTSSIVGGTLSISISSGALVPKQTTFTVRLEGENNVRRAFNFTLLGIRAGNTGISSLTIMLYQRAPFGSTPPEINFPCIYSAKTGLERVMYNEQTQEITKYQSINDKHNFSTYSTSAISGDPTGTWSRVIPNGTGTCYVTTVPVDTNGEQLILPGTWEPPAEITPKNLAGKIMRGVRLWTAGTTYDGIQDIALDANGHDTKPFYDVVYYPAGTNRRYYYCVTGHTASNNDIDTHGTDTTTDDTLTTTYWSPANQFDFIATNVLLADSAHIEILSSTGIYVYDDSTPRKVIAGIDGGSTGPNIFAGTNGQGVNGISTANFRVYGNTGRVVVKGSIEADGDNFEDSGSYVALKSNNGLWVNGGPIWGTVDIVEITAQDNTGPNTGIINLTSVGDETGTLEVRQGVVDISTQSESTGRANINLRDGEIKCVRSGVSGNFDYIVSSPGIKRLITVPAGSSAGNDANTLYFIEESNNQSNNS